MRKSNRAVIVFMFVLFEIVYVMSILANPGSAPAFINDNGTMILYASVIFNILILTSLIF